MQSGRTRCGEDGADINELSEPCRADGLVVRRVSSNTFIVTETDPSQSLTVSSHLSPLVPLLVEEAADDVVAPVPVADLPGLTHQVAHVCGGFLDEGDVGGEVRSYCRLTKSCEARREMGVVPVYGQSQTAVGQESPAHGYRLSQNGHTLLLT